VASDDGNGWVACRCGARHWGRHGAAGLLLLREGTAGTPEVLLQLRAAWTHEGGTWGLPGGARDSHEDAVAAALREAAEEADVDPALVTVDGVRPGTDHGDWAYTYVLASTHGGQQARSSTAESDAVAWVPLEEVARLPLHPGLAREWQALQPAAAAVLARD